MKGNEKNILIGAVVLAVIIVFVSYKFFYSAQIEDADAVQTEINTMNTRLAELNEKNANRSLYEAAIANADDLIDTVLSLYGPGNTPEKTIMMIVDLCKKTGCTVSDLSFGEERRVYSSSNIGGDEEENLEEPDYELEEEKPKVQVFMSGAAMNIESGYTQMKKIMDYINSYPERMNAESFEIRFDAQTGKLVTTMNLNLFSVIDDKHHYVAPVIENIELGSENVFKTSERNVEEETTEENQEKGTSETTENTEKTGDTEKNENNENNEKTDD